MSATHIQIEVIRTNGQREHHAVPRSDAFRVIGVLIAAAVTDTVRLPGGRVMIVDDLGYDTETVSHGPGRIELRPTKARRPVNPIATELYHSVCKAGTTHQIVGDVAIARDADFGEDELAEHAEIAAEPLATYATQVLLQGPRRVLINGEGEATTPKIARGKYGVTPDIVFIRHDGWSLGAPKALEDVARRTWDTDWIGVLVRPNTNPMTYADYLSRRDASTPPPPNPESETPTPWAVHCPRHGLKYLTRENYERQMLAADARWYCPECGAVSEWDDDIYEKAMGES